MSTETETQDIFPSRILHTMLRVSDIEKSEHFYCQFLGMTLQRKKDYADGEFTLAFLGYGDESNNTVLELTHNWSEQAYTNGNAYGHIALAVNDIYATCLHLERQGVEITRQPGPMKADASEVIAFIKDPDGYQIELIEKK
jgi:lactoylglutathione lyase